MKATPAAQGDTAKDKLAIDEDLPFQRNVWRFERVGWVVMGLIVLAALIGLIGAGPLSSTQTSNEGLSIEYDRFSRNLAPSEIKIRIEPSAAVDGAVTLSLNQAFGDKFQIERVVPMPSHWRLAGDGLRLRFPAEKLETSSTVRLYVKAQGFGPVAAAVGIEGSMPLTLQQFIYP